MVFYDFFSTFKENNRIHFNYYSTLTQASNVERKKMKEFIKFKSICLLVPSYCLCTKCT